MKYPTTYLKEILDAIGGVISGGKVQVDTEITATIDPGNLATEATVAELLALETTVGVPTNKTALTVAQTTAAAITTTLATARGIRVASDPANTGTIYLGGSALSLANGVDILYPGDSARITCSDAAHVFAVSATAAQSLRWEVL